MKKHTSISTALSCATSALLSSTSAVAASESPSKGWREGWALDSALLIYSEPDRVSAIEPVISGQRTTDFGSILTLKGAVDILTGASGSGAVSTDAPQTFTRPSGAGRYRVPAGETPLDDTFQDNRLGLNIDWDAAISRTLRYGLGGSLSYEYDYVSTGVNGRLTKELNQKNTTVSVSVSLARDALDPVGGVPEALGQMAAANYATRRTGERKTVNDLLLGVTQIIDARSLFQLNYGLTASSGYHTDPYKLVSLVDSSGRPFDTSSTVPSVVFEKRPASRTRHSVFGRYKRRMQSGNILDASYRYTTDDWGIDTHTLDTKYRFVMSESTYLQARLRYYVQSAADFYRPYLRQGQPLPQFVSADYRVNQMNAYTLGLEYGWGKQPRAWRLALEYYVQTPKEPSDKFGELVNQEISPSVRAIMLRINRTF